MAMDNICIPMHLDAFVLSPQCCDEKLNSKIAPFTQPNYTALRLDGQFLQHDLLDHTDFHLSQPATRNPRTADIGLDLENNLKPHRLGVHLQWSLPRLYRTATASDSATPSEDGKDRSQPIFRQIPNRWLVIRRLKNIPSHPGFKEFQCWVIESDVMHNIKTVSPDIDLESDVTPFVKYEGDSTDPGVLDAQTEVFLGQKFDLETYPFAKERSYLKSGLTVMTSSNPLFSDYALHNCNVLSMIDNFAYPRNATDSNPRDGNFSYLSSAKCDYFVLGWHADSSADPFSTPLNQEDKSSLVSRLSDLLLKLSPEEAGDQGEFKNRKDATRCLVHGAIYDVVYDFHKKPQRILVEEAASTLVVPKNKPQGKPDPKRMEPLSIGTTPLDAVLTFLEAHKDESDDVSVLGKGGGSLAHHVVELAQLLYAAADGYDSRVQAQDLIAQQNYSKTNGGSRWTFAKGAKDQSTGWSLTNDGKPKIPTKDEQDALLLLNEKQLQLDICVRKLASVKWDLFAEWFKVKAEFIPAVGSDAVFAPYKKHVEDLKRVLNGADGSSKTVGLVKLKGSLQSDIEDLRRKVDCKLFTLDPFRMRLDPTLCIAGLDSGWPSDVMDKLQVRLDHELDGDPAMADAIFANMAMPVAQDHGLRNTARKILAECLKDSNAQTKNGMNDVPTITGFQAWGNRNPFIPLFIEWEAIYYHIDKDSWDVQLRPSPVGHPHPQVRYVPGTQLLTSDPAKNTRDRKDRRGLSGRVIVLPQPQFNLQSVVLQVIDSKSPNLPKDFDLDDLKNHMQQIKMISAPLSGLTNHLLTRCEGAHVKPNVRSQGEKLITLAIAAKDADKTGLDAATLGLIDAESALTPYGSLIAFGLEDYPSMPFKPVTHGQMVFTKLNIIDKFGQAICLPPSNRRKINPPEPPDAQIYPCLSDYLAPDVIRVRPDDHSGILNTVFPVAEPAVDGQWPFCPFIQLTHSINQDARINAAFLIQDTFKDGTYSAWREATDYESPIWGWLVINYADLGLQFFLGDGTFYREIRRGGVNGTNVSTKWLPYDAEKGGLKPTDAGMHQLDQLIKQLTPDVDTDGTYLQAFFDMINGSTKNMPFPPSSYAGYANAIVGKPLALVNIGWSIELAEPPITPQFNSLDVRGDSWKGELLRYDFKLKIGDKERNFDGVVGYYNSSNDDRLSPTVAVPAPQTTWTEIFTYFKPEIPHKNVKEIDTSNFLELNPYYIDPEPESTPSITDAKNRKYTVISLLVDPYTPIHGYSPVLPTKTIQIPPWAVQTAMDKMHAFFRLGPCLVTSDVPPSYNQANARNPDGTFAAALKLPISGRKGTWTWLQPYAQDGFDDKGFDKPHRFATMDVQEDLGQIKFEQGPYTLVEGYLQLMGRLDNKGDK